MLKIDDIREMIQNTNEQKLFCDSLDSEGKVAAALASLTELTNSDTYKEWETSYITALRTYLKNERTEENYEALNLARSHCNTRRKRSSLYGTTSLSPFLTPVASSTPSPTPIPVCE